jgi:DNA-directed RNA polymerase specialized sigma24 family protein
MGRNRWENSVQAHSVAVFQTTCWQDIRAARTADHTHQRMAVAALAERYWRPVYWFLRRKGYDPEASHDLTQGFFQEIVLGHRFLELADPTKGRFRTFLLAALVRYVAGEYRRQKAERRCPHGGIRSLETCRTWEDAEPAVADPERIFIYAWATEALERAMKEVREEFCSTGREIYWRVFHEKVVAPITMETDEPSLQELCRIHAVDTEKRASNMIVTAKRRFRSVLRRILAESVARESDVDDEIGELISILSGVDTA